MVAMVVDMIFRRDNTMRVPTVNATDSPEEIKFKEKYRKVILHHLGVNKDDITAKTLYVAYHHFHPKVLLQHDEMKRTDNRNHHFPKLVDSKTAKDIGLTLYDKLEGDDYIYAPNQTLDDVDTYIKTKAMDLVLEARQTPEQERSSQQMIILTSPDSEINSLIRHPRLVRDINDEMEAERIRKEEEENEKKRKLTNERDTLINSFTCEIQHQYYIENEKKKQKLNETIIALKIQLQNTKQQVANLEKKCQSLKEDHEKMVRNIMKENHRYRLTDDQWHEEHSFFAKHFLGMETWNEFKALVKCLWPYLTLPCDNDMNTRLSK